MAHDYENIDNVGDMSDGELRAFVRDRLEEQLAFDPEDIEVAVRNGVVRLSEESAPSRNTGSSSTHSPMFRTPEVQNELVVDSLRRAESPMAIDEHLVDEQEHEGILLGDTPVGTLLKPRTSTRTSAPSCSEPRDVQKSIGGATPGSARGSDAGRAQRHRRPAGRAQRRPFSPAAETSSSASAPQRPN